MGGVSYLYGALLSITVIFLTVAVAEPDNLAGPAAEDAAARSLTTGQHAAAAAGRDNPGTLRVITQFDRSDMTCRKGKAVHLAIETNEGYPRDRDRRRAARPDH